MKDIGSFAQRPLFSCVHMKTTIRRFHKTPLGGGLFSKTCVFALVPEIKTLSSCEQKNKTKRKYLDTCGRGIGQITVDRRLPPEHQL